MDPFGRTSPLQHLSRRPTLRNPTDSDFLLGHFLYRAPIIRVIVINNLFYSFSSYDVSVTVPCLDSDYSIVVFSNLTRYIAFEMAMLKSIKYNLIEFIDHFLIVLFTFLLFVLSFSLMLALASIGHLIYVSHIAHPMNIPMPSISTEHKVKIETDVRVPMH